MSLIQNSYEVLVIGGGPAGLAAATSLARACRRVAVFDSHEYRNDVTDQIHNVLIHDGQHPERFRALARREIVNLFETVTFIETTIIRAWTFKTRDSRHEFKVRDRNGTIHRGKKLILATGSVDILPDIPGFQDLWGDVIVHGIFCDGFEKRGKAAGVLGLSSLDDIAPTLMAYFLSQNDLTIYTNGEDPSKYRFQDSLDMALARGCRLDSRKIRHFTRMEDDSIMIQFRHGGVSHLGFLMFTPPTRNRAQNLISRLGIQTSHRDGYAMARGPHGETNVRGCFVAGDTSTVNKSIAVALSSGMWKRREGPFFLRRKNKLTPSSTRHDCWYWGGETIGN
ncbi:FAD/NAD(P)-binding domain-containing protein [Penicillium waksmanii]|uniref:FAD/NAD(P)-binding domain-containing protein n=1 Tax=Penicillium waksmanii TaxID=69791 RepID=UPI00254922C3|nr:FAD/NAD(P)-binding domain-containing protein [Penicillium waksmanii]KAJ5988694.1 FAD/NAD(P)-binding domain-containing protein [Penicillium waksmanii]